MWVNVHIVLRIIILMSRRILVKLIDLEWMAGESSKEEKIEMEWLMNKPEIIIYGHKLPAIPV